MLCSDINVITESSNDDDFMRKDRNDFRKTVFGDRGAKAGGSPLKSVLLLFFFLLVVVVVVVVIFRLVIVMTAIVVMAVLAVFFSAMCYNDNYYFKGFWLWQ